MNALLADRIAALEISDRNDFLCSFSGVERDAIVAALRQESPDASPGVRERIAQIVANSMGEGIHGKAPAFLQAADAILTAPSPPSPSVTDAMVETAWAAIVGRDVAPMCFQASIIRADLKDGLIAALAAQPAPVGET